MINFLLGLGTMLIVTLLFSFIRSKIINSAKKTAASKFNCYVGNVYKKNGKEAFQWKKFAKMFTLFDKVEWIKSIKEMIDLRKLTIYLLIAGSVYAWAYYQGRINSVVKFNLDFEKAFKLKLDGHYLVKPKDSARLEIQDPDGTVIKVIRAKDLPDLAKKLKPVGFELKPIGVLGYGVGESGGSFEGGAGISFLRYWKWRIETFLTNKGAYLGTSRKITDNSSLGIGAGKGYKGDNRVLLYYRWEFM